VAEETKKTASQVVREEADKLARDDKAVHYRAAAAAVENANWGKNLDPAHKMALEKLANECGLSIVLGDIIILGGSPYITIKGQLKHAHNTGQFKGFVDEGPLPRNEWTDYGVPEDAQSAWRTKVKRDGCETLFIEVGWAGGKREANQPVARDFPGEIARKRSRARALQLAFPTSFSSFEDATHGIEIPEDFMARVQQAATQPVVAPETYARIKLDQFKAALAPLQATPAEALAVAKTLYKGIKRLDDLMADQAQKVLDELTKDRETVAAQPASASQDDML